jgi:uncharacterized phage infection (PIP) family protein YhgE
VNSAVGEIEKAFKESEDGGVAQFPALLNQLLDKVQSLESRTKESVSQEINLAENLKHRIAHLRQGCDQSMPVSAGMWKKTRYTQHFPLNV